MWIDYTGEGEEEAGRESDVHEFAIDPRGCGNELRPVCLSSHFHSLRFPGFNGRQTSRIWTVESVLDGAKDAVVDDSRENEPVNALH